MYSDTRMKTPWGVIEERTAWEQAAFAPRWWTGKDAATASGLGQVRGETALRDTTQRRGTWIAIPADFGAAFG